MTNDSPDELISAAIDGEPVDPATLRAALATDEGRQTLASFVLMRAAVAADAIDPPAELPGVSADRGTDERANPWTGRWRLAAGLASVAAVLLAVASFWLGATWRSGLTSRGGDVEVRSQGTVTGTGNLAGQARTPMDATEPDEPPTPTRVLRFTPGVDWHPSS